MKRLGTFDLRAVVIAWHAAGCSVEWDATDALGIFAARVDEWQRRHGWNMAGSSRD